MLSRRQTLRRQNFALFGMTETLHSARRSDWCAHWSSQYYACLRIVDTDSWIGEQDSGNWNEMLPQTPLHLIKRKTTSQMLRYRTESQTQRNSWISSDKSEEMEIKVVWACHEIYKTYQNNPTRTVQRKEKERKTEKEMEDKHRVDRKCVEWQSEESGGQREMAWAGCQIQWCHYSGLDYGIVNCSEEVSTLYPWMCSKFDWIGQVVLSGTKLSEFEFTCFFYMYLMILWVRCG